MNLVWPDQILSLCSKIKSDFIRIQIFSVGLKQRRKLDVWILYCNVVWMFVVIFCVEKLSIKIIFSSELWTIVRPSTKNKFIFI